MGKKRKNMPGYMFDESSKQWVRDGTNANTHRISGPRAMDTYSDFSTGTQSHEPRTAAQEIFYSPEVQQALDKIKSKTAEALHEENSSGSSDTQDMMSVGFDLDGVVADYNSHIKSVSKWKGTDKNPSYYSFVKSGMFDDFDSFWDAHMTVSKSTSQTPILDTTASDSMKKLQELGHEVVIVTARPPEAVEETFKFLEKNGMYPDRVIFSDDKSDDRHGIDVIIDDAPKNVKMRVDKELPVVMMSSSYENEVTTMGVKFSDSPSSRIKGSVTRVASCAEYVDIVLSEHSKK